MGLSREASGDKIATVGPQRQFPDGYRRLVMPTKRSAKKRTRRELHGRTMPSYSQWRNGGKWSAYQANKYVYYGADWKNDVIAPKPVSHRRLERTTSPDNLGNADCRQFRPRGL